MPAPCVSPLSPELIFLVIEVEYSIAMCHATSVPTSVPTCRHLCAHLCTHLCAHLCVHLRAHPCAHPCARQVRLQQHLRGENNNDELVDAALAASSCAPRSPAMRRLRLAKVSPNVPLAVLDALSRSVLPLRPRRQRDL